MSNTGSANSNPKYAWSDLVHRGLPKRSGQERVSDFLEIYGLYDDETAREQASRCIQCPNPSCVSGCPMCNPIPQWMQLTAEGRFLEAAAVLGSVSCMADICARVCPQERLCEENCILNGTSEPVAIASIEHFLAEYGAAHGHLDTSTPPPNGLKVAVVGSGPGGLACAEELAKMGYAITIFDASLVPGGLLVNGTPTFKLEKSIIERRVQILQKRGVQFRLGVTLGEDLMLGELRAQFSAVFLGLDSRSARPLKVPGAEARGVMQALPFILQKNTPVPLELPPMDLTGKRVVVVGGGDTAIDCVRIALRCGAREVLCSYRRDQDAMPCTPHEFQNALEEGAKFLFQTEPVEVLSTPDDELSAIRLVRTTPGSKGADGRTIFAPQPSTEFVLETDWVILALGFDHVACPHSGSAGDLGTNEWGGLIVDGQQMTSIPGVFAGGDVVRGPSLVLHTVRDGRNAARGIHAYLSETQSARS
jgi:glutamate synthase (NADPH/NADH) small chain